MTTISYIEKTTPFKRWNEKKKCISDKPKEEMLKIKRNGKLLSLQEFINENNRDCTIYDVLNTYRGDLKLTQARLNVLTKEVSDDLQQIDGLRDAMEIMKKAKETWANMPLEIRKEFKNDISNFQVNGLNWAKSKIKEQKEIEQKMKLEAEKGDVNNG